MAITYKPGSYSRKLLDPATDDAAPTWREWVGAFTDPTNGDWLAIYQKATGTNVRQGAPQSWYDAYNTHDPFNSPGAAAANTWDHYSLNNVRVMLRSSNAGDTWAAHHTEDCNIFSGPDGSNPGHIIYMVAMTAQADIKLANGNLLRRINGEDVSHHQGSPGTAYAQRSVDGGRTWQHAGPGGALCVFGINTAAEQAQFARMYVLSTGELIAVGQLWDCPSGTRLSRNNTYNFMKPLIMASSDNGQTWHKALVLPSAWGSMQAAVNPTPNTNCPTRIAPNEWSVAEKADGTLRFMCRTNAQYPWDGVDKAISTAFATGVLTRSTDAQGRLVFVWPTVSSAIKFPAILNTGGGAATYPDLKIVPVGAEKVLLMCNRGTVPAAAAFYWSFDEGATWAAIPITGKTVNVYDPYYGRWLFKAVSPTDTRVACIAHVGGDLPYEPRNKSGSLIDGAIVQHAFTLQSDQPASGGGGGATAPDVPTFSPNGGTFTAASVAVMITSTPGATVYYTTDGTTPTTSSPSIAAGGTITLSPSASAQTIKALAVKDALASGVATSAAFTITAPPQSDTITLPGPFRPTTFTSDASNGGTDAWTAAASSTTSDNAKASNSLSTGETSQYLKTTGYGIVTGVTGYTVASLKATFERSQTAAAGAAQDAAVRIVKGGTVQAVPDKALSDVWPLETAETTATYTFNDVDLAAITLADLESPNFGLALAAQNPGGAATFAKIDDHFIHDVVLAKVPATPPADPTITPTTGTVPAGTYTVTLSTNDPAASIYYSTSSSTSPSLPPDPAADMSNYTAYTGPFAVTVLDGGLKKIKAVAENDAGIRSGTVLVTLTAAPSKPAPPTISPASGDQPAGPVSATITGPSGTTLYYATSASTSPNQPPDPLADLSNYTQLPTNPGTVTGALIPGGILKIKAVARNNGTGTISDATLVTYTENGVPVATTPLTALTGLAVVALVNGLRVLWDDPPTAQAVVEIHGMVRETTTSTYGPELQLGLGTPAGQGRSYADFLNLTAGTSYTIGLIPYAQPIEGDNSDPDGVTTVTLDPLSDSQFIAG